MTSLLQAIKQTKNGTQTKAPHENLVYECVRNLEEELYKELKPEKMAELILNNPQAAQRKIEHLLVQIMRQQRFSLINEERLLQARQILLAKLLGLGPLDALLHDETVTEIMVNGAESIFFERAGKLFMSDAHFESDDEVRRVIDQIITPLGRRLDESNPVVNARLKEGHRVHAIIPPLSLSGPILTIRKFQKDVYSLEDLAEMGSLPLAAVSFLRALVRARKNIAVSGGTGSGKTTFLNTLSQEISPKERIITIEDSAELRFARHPHVVSLESRAANLDGKGAITLRDLVINSLRMRPDRIVVGEVRGQEALEMLQAMNTGHDGSMTTLHANSSHEVAPRLITMVGYGAQFSQAQVLSQIHSALDVIIHLERTFEGKRQVKEIALVNGIADDQLILKNVYQSSISKETLFVPESFAQELIAKGSATPEEAQTWMS